MRDNIEEIVSGTKQTGYLKTRHTKVSTLSKEWKYYIPLDFEENKLVEFRYFNGRIYGDIIEKLGLIEDILEVISIDQLMALVKTKRRR